MGARVAWVFTDNEVDPVETYSWVTNPHTDRGSFGITKANNYQVAGASFYTDTFGEVRVADSLVGTGAQEQRLFSFEGFSYDQQHLAFLYHWVGKDHPVELSDDLGRVFRVFLTGLNVSRVRARNRWKHSYSFEGAVLEEIFS